MKKYGQRVLAVLLCVCMVFSCMTVSAHASDGSGGWALIKDILDATGAIDKWAQALEYNSADDIMPKVFQDVTGRTHNYNIVRPSKLASSFSQVLKVNLNCIAQDWNANYRHYGDIDWTVRTIRTQIRGAEAWVLAVNVPKSEFVMTTGYDIWFLCDGSGNVLYATADDTGSPAIDGKFISANKLSSPYKIVSHDTLKSLAEQVGGTVRKSGEYYFIFNSTGSQIYHSADGLAYAAMVNSDEHAVNQDRPMAEGSVTNNITNNNNTENITNNYISNTQIDEGDTFYTYNTTNNSYNTTNETYETIINNIKEGDTYYVKEGDTYYEIVVDNSMDFDIDIENMTMVGEGGVINNIDSLIYDTTSKTYYLSTFFGAGDTYEYNYYTYEYHINYTSVTYIGYTEQYDKHYELYYQLPDGRSSADLTVADLEQLSTSFKDVVNYARSADDLSQRALYHFDGNTEDSSYWSYCSSFDWAKGASLTYMDEGTFGGSLYLDETEHDFTLTLPANDAAGDWTMQFRYYQSHTESPVLDSYITVGGVKLFQFDGAKYYNGSGTAITATSVGSWNEICLMRKDGTLYYYINGVPYGSMAVSIGTSAVRFYFGATQQTYKKLDELRFTRGAIYEAGKGYTPTSVPYDSNLSLVLPDGKVPLADEVMVLRPSTNNLLSSVGLADWTDSGVIDSLEPYTAATTFEKAYQRYSNVGVSFFYNSSYTTLTPNGDSVGLSCAGTTGMTNAGTTAEPINNLANGVYLPVCTTNKHWHDSYGMYLYEGTTLYTPGQPYTLSVVLADGSYSWLTFQVTEKTSGNYSYYTVSIVDKEFSSVLNIGTCHMVYKTEITNDNRTDYGDIYEITNYGFRFYPSTTGTVAEIIHAELVEGSASQFSVSYEGAVYDPGELENSPVLAVRSNTPISTYQIGGVRPSYPKKGQVYAMVENGYITSLQQYTGSAWEAVDGRIWTGSRWIPASSYNVITLQDMYDIVDATPDYEYIYTESGFWDWFQRAWKDLLTRLDKIIEGQKGSGGGTALDPEDDTMLPSVEDNPETDTDEGWGAYDLLIVIKDGTWSIITGIVRTGFNGLVGLVDGFTHVTVFFDAFSPDSSSNVLGVMNYGGADIWD